MKIIREILRPEPQVLYLEPFFGCNYRCPFCIHGSGHAIEPVQLSPLVFGKLKPLIERVSHVHITGLGEPFLNRHLPDYLSYLREKGKSYYIITNGSLLEDAHIELMATSESELSVSLDAGDRATYGRIRHPTNWESVIARLKRVSRIKAERRSHHPLVYLTFHLNALNLMSLKEIPELGHKLGIDAVKLSWTMLPETHRDHSIFANQETVAAIVNGVSDELRKRGIHVQSEAVFGRRLRGCWNSTPMTFVEANGAVAACCNRWLTIGHLSENSFEDIWNGMPRRAIALGIINDSPEAGCDGCPQIRGVDYAQNEGDFLKPRDLDNLILAEKARNIGRLPSLQGLEGAFRSGVAALMGKDLPAAASIFSPMAEKFPDYFEIKNNLAVVHYYLGNIEKCRELLAEIKGIPHNESLLRANLACV